MHTFGYSVVKCFMYGMFYIHVKVSPIRRGSRVHVCSFNLLIVIKKLTPYFLAIYHHDEDDITPTEMDKN